MENSPPKQRSPGTPGAGSKPPGVDGEQQRRPGAGGPMRPGQDGAGGPSRPSLDGAGGVSKAGQDGVGGPPRAGQDGAGSSKQPVVASPPAGPPMPKFKQMQRKGPGTKGQAVQLHVNHFKVNFKPREDVFHYNVTIEPETKKVVSRKVMDKLYVTFGREFLAGKRFAYDGEKSLFTVGQLAFNSHQFPIHLDDEPGYGRRGSVPAGNGSPDGGEGRPSQRRRVGGRDFSVEIKFAARVNMSAIQSVIAGSGDEAAQKLAQDGLRVLDIMLREHAAKRDYLLIRDSYFHKSLGKVEDIGEGVEAWRGFHVSFRPTSGNCLTLNFDLSTTTVIKPTGVRDFIQEYCKKDVRQFREQDWQKVRRVLKGIQVETYAGRKMKITGISQRPCHELTFERKLREPGGDVSETAEITVADYFIKERNVPLRYAQLPALDLGRNNKPQYFPIELCKIVEGQRYKRNLSNTQRKNHVDSCRQLPDQRKKICMDAMTTNNYNEDELVKEFGVQIDRNMAVVRGRVLDPPSLVFGNREEKPSNGRWNFNSKKVKQAKAISKWAVANFARNPAQPLVRQLMNVCASKGLNFMGEPTIFDENRQMTHRGAEERVRDMILRQMESLRPEFVLAVLPEKSSDLYAPLKRICETGKWMTDQRNPNEPRDPKDPQGAQRLQVNIVTQCVVPPRNVKDQYLTNVALKINIKWGGYNTILAHEERKSLPLVSKVPTCIFGLDVSHGSPGDASSPSIAAAVASNHWPKFSTYTARVRAQAPKTEMIEALYEERNGRKGGMIMDLLNDFFRTCEGPNVESRKPQQFVIFRDGVSESQFDQVLEKELTAFKRAARGLESNPNSTYNPKVTLIVVQKRHHTRFFPAQGSGNVRPGTIVDRDVCHPRDNDFFLISHAGLIGTSRPTHYHVLYDEIGFTPDQLQELTHCLCYSYARCTTAVSVAAPAYYAHLAAQHCRNFVASDSSGSESSIAPGRQGIFTPLPPLNTKLLDKMFYT